MIVAMWAGHTDRSRALANLLQATWRAKGLKDETAAAEMHGLSPAQLCRAIAGVEGLSMWRFAELPDPVKDAFYQACIEARGGKVLWRSEVEFIRAYLQIQRERKRMAKMIAPAVAEKESA